MTEPDLSKTEIQIEQDRLSIRDRSRDANFTVGGDVPTLTIETAHGHCAARLSDAGIERLIEELQAHK